MEFWDWVFTQNIFAADINNLLWVFSDVFRDADFKNDPAIGVASLADELYRFWVLLSQKVDIFSFIS
jgi:hypothetical protein